MLLLQTLSERLLYNMDEGTLKSWLQTILPEVMAFFWSVILAFVVFWIGRRIIRRIVSVTVRAMEKRHVEKGVLTFTDSVLRGALYVLLFVVILNLFGISASSIAAAVAALGLTAGLSLQGSLSNFAGGVLILVLHPFTVGDYIIEDTHRNEGTVMEITIFYTKLCTIDQRIIVIPNGMLANTSLTNVTKQPRRQMDLTFSISYEDDIRKAKDVLTEVVEGEEAYVRDRGLLVFVRTLGESAVELGVRFFVPTEEYWSVYWRMNERVKYAFDEAGIRIPYRQTDVHIR